MDILPRENEIALFRYRNRLMAGVCLNASRSKVRFALSPKESVNVPFENVLLLTGQMASEKVAGQAWFENAERESAHIHLAETWELVREEEDSWALWDLADLVYGDSPTPGQVAALLMALDRGDYFEADGRLFRPLDETRVFERLAAIEREREREGERARFQAWFAHGDLVSADAQWIERLKDVALLGEQSVHARWFERLLGDTLTDRQAFDRLVGLGVWSPHIFLDLLREGVPVVFPEVVIQQAEKITLDAVFADLTRENLTHLDAVTIDDASTQDMDDAVSIQFRDDGSFQVGIHIADVSALFGVGSDLDAEALSRGASLYFPDDKIPMLPPVISDQLGSLYPGEDRAALSLLFEVDPAGHVGVPRFVPSVIHCREKLSYDAVDAMIDDESHPRHAMLSTLFYMAEQLLCQRIENGAVAVAHADRRVIVEANGDIHVEMQSRSTRADLLVSEWMVMANAATAQWLTDHDIPVFYRVQHTPELSDIDPTEIEQLHRYRVLTQMRPASSSLTPGPHGGLGVSCYCQASSPLRRFMDLIAQRQLMAALKGQLLPYSVEDLKMLGPHIDEHMRCIGRLERRRERYWLFRYLERFRGQVFEGLVLDVWERGCRIEILAYALQTDLRPTHSVTPGTLISVRLGRVDAWADEIVFVMG